ncbi:proline hydroxylase [Aphanothece hegewaldii CCALA 016]|uniref:Proline hydroxylase n=1 Tax=Aphanothece hegewaldii CCALA 016 TaxID=2107694 RepID=A0A2T1M427_9CHRO|nr:2OG-Fe(II) oxygenase [Aphanothece hegewaldii]PSF39585.1 proline hydroxylase [Aphanothece hegewaldii CCALA 016]
MITTDINYHLDPEYLEQLAIQYHQAYQQAKPFPHIIIENFLSEAILNQVLEEFPKPQSINWRQFDNISEKKLASNSELQMGPMTRSLLYQLNSSTFITFLEKLTGIDGLIPDPHFVGGGLHQIEKGGYLKIHADFNKHQKLNLDRRLNLLIYLNKDWQEEYGGYFELWDQEMKSCQKKVLPIFNRCVIFSTTDFSYHGHPEALTCPEDRTRKSLALYYYSNGRPPEEVSAPHSTLFQARPNENLKEKIDLLTQSKVFFKKLIPPILLDFKQYFRKKN